MARYCVVDDILSAVISHYYVTIFTILLEPTAKDGVRKNKGFLFKVFILHKREKNNCGNNSDG